MADEGGLPDLHGYLRSLRDSSPMYTTDRLGPVIRCTKDCRTASPENRAARMVFLTLLPPAGGARLGRKWSSFRSAAAGPPAVAVAFVAVFTPDRRLPYR